jgi:hypothetical protein
MGRDKVNKYLRWALLLPVVFFTTVVIARILSPFACLLVRYEVRTDVVKRQNKQVITMMREYLPKWLSWFETDDNAVDEYWYGVYPLTKYFSQEDYDNSWWIRYLMRVCWLQRNSAYTFKRKYFGLEKDSPHAWQIKGFDRLMYAGRILTLPKKLD